MQLVDAPDTDDLFFRKVDESGLIELGIYGVIFGYRVRAGFAGEGTLWWDWCGGANYTQIMCLYATAQAILVQRKADKNAFRGLPAISRVKPYIHDPEFVTAIIVAAGDIAPHLPTWKPNEFSERARSHKDRWETNLIR